MKSLRRILVFSLLLGFMIVFGQKNVEMIQFKNTESVFQIKGLSQVVEVPLGTSKMLILSGQVPVNQKGEVVEQISEHRHNRYSKISVLFWSIAEQALMIL